MSDEKKGVVKESKSSGSSSKKLPKSKTDSERTTSDQATSTKKSRCQGDFTPPSFDLGIDAAFDYVVVVGKIVQETKASKTEEVLKKEDFISSAVNKRLPKLSSYVVSPYNKRQVDLSVKATDTERKLFSWIIDSANDEKYDPKTIIFHSQEEESVRKEWFVSAIAEEMSHTPWLKPNNVDLEIICPLFRGSWIVVKAASVKNLKPDRLSMHWRNSKNKRDCGVYVMRHMESYMGNGLDVAKETIVGKGEVVKEKDEAPKDKNEA
ncbi:hypothetical protein V2J09_008799 [Rumex salicifolius]